MVSPTGPCPWANKKPSPFFVWSPWQNKGPDLPTTFQILENLLCKERTWAARTRLVLQGEDLLCKDKTCPTRRRLALQGEDLLYKKKTYSARIRLVLQGEDLLYKERSKGLTTIKAPTSSSHKRYAWLTPL